MNFYTQYIMKNPSIGNGTEKFLSYVLKFKAAAH